jgi:hypothetical protein
MRCLNIYCKHNMGNICNIPSQMTIDKNGLCTEFISEYKCDGCGCELNSTNNHYCLNYCDSCVERKSK